MPASECPKSPHSDKYHCVCVREGYEPRCCYCGDGGRVMTFADPVVVTAVAGGFLGSVFGSPWGIVGLLLGTLSGWLMFRRTGQDGRDGE